MNDRQPLPAETVAVVRRIFEQEIPFNRLLGFELGALEPGRAHLEFDLREDLVGNFVRGVLHGGVISAVLDSVGGLAALLDVLHGARDEPSKRILERLARIGTIDLRVDYLRPSAAHRFRATGSVLRAGGRVAVTRMELHDEAESLLAVATGAYRLG